MKLGEMNPTQSELAESHDVSENKLGRGMQISHTPALLLTHQPVFPTAQAENKLRTENTFLESPEGKASHTKGVSCAKV